MLRIQISDLIKNRKFELFAQIHYHNDNDHKVENYAYFNALIE